MRPLSEAADRLEGQKMFQVLAQAQELERQGRHIIHFEIGDPDFPTPKNIVEAACEALNRGETHYCTSAGLRDYRLVAAEVTEKSRGFKPSIDQILVTAGANVQIYYSMACIADPGEEIIIPDPSFVSYGAIAKFLNVKAVGVPLYEEKEFRLNPDDVEKAITDKTRMILINSPQNPTGAVMTEEEITQIYDIARRHDLYLLSDEVYARMIYADSQARFFSPSQFDRCQERVLVAHAFSKSYAMTGWRIGAITGPAKLIAKMGLLLETTSSCVSPFIQRAAIEALKGSQEPIATMVKEFRARRDLMFEELNKLPGISCVKPRGAFYIFPNIKKTGLTSQLFSDLMLEVAGVATCPGNFFGKNGEGFVRLCYATSMENIREGVRRMRDVLSTGLEKYLGGKRNEAIGLRC